jgi:NDP-sugar pyrophosphorylase family protein
MNPADHQDVSVAILAGGLGTRLRPALADRPKVLAPVAGRPFIGYLLDQLARAGLREVVLLVGYCADQVQAALGEQYAGVQLRYSVEPSPQGTAGAVRLALPLLTRSRLLLLNGDSYCDADLGELLRQHVQSALPVSMTLAQVADSSRFGRVELAQDGRVCQFVEKGREARPGWINAGIYLLDRSLLETMPATVPLALEWDVLPSWVTAGLVRGHCCSGLFLDIGTPESYAGAEAFLRLGAWNSERK